MTKLIDLIYCELGGVSVSTTKSGLKMIKHNSKKSNKKMQSLQSSMKGGGPA